MLPLFNEYGARGVAANQLRSRTQTQVYGLAPSPYRNRAPVRRTLPLGTIDTHHNRQARDPSAARR